MALTLIQAPTPSNNQASGSGVARLSLIGSNGKLTPAAQQANRPAPVPVASAPYNPIIDNPFLKGVGKVADKVVNTVNNLPEAHFADKTNFWTPLGFISHVAQGIVNTPAEALKGASDLGKHIGQGDSSTKQVLGDVAAAAQLPLLLLSFGTSSVAKEGVVGAVKVVGEQGVKGVAKAIGKEATIGGGFGALSGLQSGKNIQDNGDYLKNLLVNIGIGTAAGGGIGALSQVVAPLAKGMSNKLGAVFIKSVDKTPEVDHIQLAPSVAQHMVMNNQLESQPVGKAILKESMVAQNQDLHVSITPSKSGEFPLGNTKVDVGTAPVYEPSATPKLNGVKPMTEEVPAAQAPVGVGAVKTSSLGLSVEQTAIEKKLTQDLGELPQYQQMNMKEQAKMASDLLISDPERALKIAMGEEKPPEGLQAESVFKAMEGSITTPELAKQLANSPLVTEATALGQRIKALDTKVSDSPVEAMKQVVDARTKAIEDRLGKTVNQATKDTVKEIQSKIKQPDKNDWGRFIESIKC